MGDTTASDFPTKCLKIRDSPTRDSALGYFGKASAEGHDCYILIYLIVYNQPFIICQVI